MDNDDELRQVEVNGADAEADADNPKERTAAVLTNKTGKKSKSKSSKEYIVFEMIENTVFKVLLI